MPSSDTLHHPYICPCFWRKHFYTPLFLDFLWNVNFRWATAGLLERLPNNSGNKEINVTQMHDRVCSTLWDVAGWATQGKLWWVGARCITSVWIGYHVAELAVKRVGHQNRGLGGCSPPKTACFRKLWR